MAPGSVAVLMLLYMPGVESLGGLGLAAISLLLLPGAGISVYRLLGLGLLQMLVSVPQAALRLVAFPLPLPPECQN